MLKALSMAIVDLLLMLRAAGDAGLKTRLHVLCNLGDAHHGN